MIYSAKQLVHPTMRQTLQPLYASSAPVHTTSTTDAASSCPVASTVPQTFARIFLYTPRPSPPRAPARRATRRLRTARHHGDDDSVVASLRLANVVRGTRAWQPLRNSRGVFAASNECTVSRGRTRARADGHPPQLHSGTQRMRYHRLRDVHTVRAQSCTCTSGRPCLELVTHGSFHTASCTHRRRCRSSSWNAQQVLDYDTGGAARRFCFLPRYEHGRRRSRRQ